MDADRSRDRRKIHVWRDPSSIKPSGDSRSPIIARSSLLCNPVECLPKMLGQVLPDLKHLLGYIHHVPMKQIILSSAYIPSLRSAGAIIPVMVRSTYVYLIMQQTLLFDIGHECILQRKDKTRISFTTCAIWSISTIHPDPSFYRHQKIVYKYDL